MSEHFFGLHRGRRNAQTIRALDAAAVRHGAYGYTQIEDPPHNNPPEYRGWFAGPNRGEPFDSSMASAVMGDPAVVQILEAEISGAAQALGRRGGAVRGRSKSRGGADHYRALQARSAQARRDRKGPGES